MSIRQIAGFLMLCLCLAGKVNARQPDQGGDTSKPDFLTGARQYGKQETINSIEKFNAGRIAIRQEQLLKDIRHTSQQAKLTLNKGIDTVDFRQYLSRINSNLSKIDEGVFVNAGMVQTQRNLAVTSSVLEELLNHTNSRRLQLEKYIDALTGYVDRIDSLSTDSALYTFPLDSAGTVKYLQRMAVVSRELGPTDTALRKTIVELQQLQTEVDLTVFSMNARIEEIGKMHDRLESSTFEKEFPFLWEAPMRHKPTAEIFTNSLAKEKLALGFYLKEHYWRIGLLVVLIMIGWYFLRSLKQKIANEKSDGLDGFGNLVLHNPPLSTIIVVLTIFQFIFLHPPYIFGFVLWLIIAICLALLLRKYITAFWNRFWMVLIAFFALSGLDNMILEASRTERWFALLLSLGGMLYGIFILRNKKRAELKEKKILYFVAFMVFLEAAATIFNIAGRYNIAKTSMVVGFTGAVIAVQFLWTVRLINETLSLVAGVYKHPDRKLFYIDFDRIGDKVPRFFYVFIVLGWFALVSRNFYGFRKLATPFMEFLNTERTLGSYSFTIYSLFIFLLIISVSTILSQVISFFAGEPGDQRVKDKQARTPGVGSWLLLIRIFILSLGLFLAFAATGIPLDKLAIVLGALGVGIGLGLQGLVSNLVSGLIIAFEKPVNVGDIIELNDKSGIMQSIGFRSSVVKLTDGACLIVPNSDLLSNRLVNWTMGKNRRRLNVEVSVAYGSNLKEVKETLEQILHGHEKVLQFPDPIVSAKEFQQSAVAFELHFWIANTREFLQIKSEIVSLVHETFGHKGIKIPFSQYDVHIINDGKTVNENKQP